MSLVVNMHQRRTVASGRQNQDPNTPVVPEKEKTPKQACPKLERSIQEVLNHTRNTTGRGRRMVLEALQKKQAAEETSPAATKHSQPRKNSRVVNAKMNFESARSAVVPIELKGDMLSISDNRKRSYEHDETRAPLSALNGSIPNKVESDFTLTASPVKSSSREAKVYSKRSKTGSTPPTPPLRSSGRRQEMKTFSPPRPLVFELKSPHLRNEELSLPEASKRIVNHVAEKDSSHPVRRLLMSPTKELSVSNGLSFIRNNEKERDSFALLRDLETQDLEVETQPSISFAPNSSDALLLEFETQPSFSIIPNSARRLHGLINLGNTCYMNVIVQVLCNLPSFVNGMEWFFGPIASQNALEGSESFPDIESVHAALLKVFRDLKRAERYEIVNPTLLKHAFAKHQSSFWGCIQQDAHEFFCSLIDQVQEDVSSALKKQYSMEADRPKLETVCPTTQNFSCSVRNNLTCAGCGNVSPVEETYRDFSLALPEDERTDESKNCSLESLLNLYFQESTMSRKCENCGVEDTKAKAQFLKLPHVLVLQLKRLHMDRDIPCTKVSAPVKFTSRLDIGPWCAQDKQKFWSPAIDNVRSSDRVESRTSNCTPENNLRTGSEGNMDCGLATSIEFQSQELPSIPKARSASADLSTCYRLHGVVNHLGHNAFGGHFLTDILDPEADRWLRCDDSLVTDVSEESVFANVREAYMFFYVHEPAGAKVSD